MKNVTVVLFCLFIGGVVGIIGYREYIKSNPILSPIAVSPTMKPLQQFSITNLANYQGNESKLIIEKEIFKEDKLTAYQFRYQTGGKKMTGQMMVPNTATPSAGFPAILMIRGFVDPNIYKTGMGTKNGAKFFAGNGMVTIAPDFLGFGESDFPPNDAMESRLERPQQLMDLIKTMKTLPLINQNKIGVWGHSNGGQIALTLMVITRWRMPVVLWAPVSAPFPYSILYYSNEASDSGKALRKNLAGFERDYDVFDFSFNLYLDRIEGLIQLHQGGRDEAVPPAWSNQLNDKLKEMGKSVNYYTYPMSDHNMQPDWQTVINRDLNFFLTNWQIGDGGKN